MSIKYPLLKLCPKYIQGAIKNEKDFLIASKKANLSMIYLKCILIDSNGVQYKITKAKFGSKLLILSFFVYTDPVYRVNINYIAEGKLTLEEIKNKLIKKIKNYRKMKMIREAYIEEIQKATSIEEVINIVEIYP